MFSEMRVLQPLDVRGERRDWFEVIVYRGEQSQRLPRLFL